MHIPRRLLPGTWLTLIGRHGALFMMMSVIVGLLAPPIVLPARPYLLVAMGFTTLGAYLTVSYSAERSWLQTYVAIVTIWAALVPAGLVAGTTFALGIEPGLATGILLAHLAPPASSAPAVAALLDLSPKLALAAFASGTLASPVTMPVIAALIGLMLDLEVTSFGLRVFAAVGGGWATAWLVGRNRGHFEWLVPEQAAATGIAVASISLVFAVAAARARLEWNAGGSDFLRLVAIAAVLNLVLLAIGAGVFSLLGFKDGLTAGLLTGNRNVGLAWASAGSQVPPAAERYLAASLLIIALLPIMLQQSLRLSSRLRRRPLPDIMPLPDLSPFNEPETVQMTVPAARAAGEIAWAPAGDPGAIATRLLEYGHTYRIGRSIDSDILLMGETVSRQHATLTVGDDGTLTIHDTASTNGLRFNGAVTTEARLGVGDVVDIGGWRLSLLPADGRTVFIEWIVPEPGTQSHSLTLTPGQIVTIGRDEGVDIQLTGAHVSRRHATVVLGLDGRVRVTDLGSMNGMRFDGRVVRAAILGSQAIHIGGYAFRVHRTAAK